MRFGKGGESRYRFGHFLDIALIRGPEAKEQGHFIPWIQIERAIQCGAGFIRFSGAAEAAGKLDVAPRRSSISIEVGPRRLGGFVMAAKLSQGGHASELGAL